MRHRRHDALARLLLLGLALSWPILEIHARPLVPPSVRGPAPTEHLIDEDMGHCLDLRETDPVEAIEVATRILGRPALPPAQEIITLTCLGSAAATAGPPERAAAAVARIEILLAEHSFDPAFRLRAFSQAGGILQRIGHLHAAIDLYARAYRAAEDDETRVAQIVALNNIASIHGADLGDPDGAERYFLQAQALADAETGYDGSVLDYNHAENLIRLGRNDEALPLLERASAMAQLTGRDLVALRARAWRAALADSTPEVRIDRLQAIARDQAALPDAGGEAATRSLLAEQHLRTGDAAAALPEARRALELSDTPGEAYEHRRALRNLIAALSDHGDLREALETSARLVALIEREDRMRDMQRLAELQARLEDAEQAQALDVLRVQQDRQALILAETRLFRNWALALLCLLAAGTIAFALYQRRIQRRLRELGATDAMTGLLNRGAVTARLRTMPGLPSDPAGSRRNVVFLLDADHFKRLNDLHGHMAGDTLLVALASRLRDACRPGDIVARWGGEEFLIACCDVDQTQAWQIAERLRSAIASTPVEIGDGVAVPLSVSIGLAPWPFFGDARRQDPDLWQDAVMLADRALYASKRGGRDAWTALWGTSERSIPLSRILESPGDAARAGYVTIRSSLPEVIW